MVGAKRIRETRTGIKRDAVSAELDRGSGLEQLYLDVQFEPLVDANDEVGGLLIVLVDVTERVRAERRAEGAVGESEARLRRVYEAIGAGLLVRDRDGTIIFANHEAAQIFGVDAATLIGSKGATGVTRFTEDGVPMEQDAVPSATTLREARQLRDVRSRLRRADGTEVWCRVDAVPVVGTDGTAEYVVTTIIDITDRHRAEQRLALRARQQTAIAELGRLSLAANDLDALFAETVRTVNGLLGAEACQVIEHSPSERRISVRAGTRLARDTTVDWIPDDAAGSQAGYTLAHGTEVISNDLANETRFKVHGHVVKGGFRATATVLIPGHERPFGVLAAVSRATFTQEDLVFLRSAANVIGEAIERLAAIERVRANEAACARSSTTCRSS